MKSWKELVLSNRDVRFPKLQGTKESKSEEKGAEYKTSSSSSSEKRQRALPQSSNMSLGESRTDSRACYSYGQIGHMQWNCPHAPVQSQYRPPPPYRPIVPVTSPRPPLLTQQQQWVRPTLTQQQYIRVIILDLNSSVT